MERLWLHSNLDSSDGNLISDTANHEERILQVFTFSQRVWFSMTSLNLPCLGSSHHLHSSVPPSMAGCWNINYYSCSNWNQNHNLSILSQRSDRWPKPLTTDKGFTTHSPWPPGYSVRKALPRFSAWILPAGVSSPPHLRISSSDGSLGASSVQDRATDSLKLHISGWMTRESISHVLHPRWSLKTTGEKTQCLTHTALCISRPHCWLQHVFQYPFWVALSILRPCL